MILNVHLSPGLIREVKFLALDRQQSMSVVVRDALEAYVVLLAPLEGRLRP